MTWLAWRQHRAECLTLGCVLMVLAILLLVTGLNMAQTFQQLDLASCFARPGNSNICPGLEEAFQHQYQPLYALVFWSSLLPALLGMLVGAPLVARELEQGTHRLVWTQSITRFRWLSIKLALVLSIGLLASAILMVLLSWWYGPFSHFDGHFNPQAFDFEGPMWLSSAVLALAVGVFAGTLTRRTVLAVFLTLVLFLAMRFSVETYLRPNYQPVVTQTWSINQQGPPPALSNDNWIIDQGFIDTNGNKTYHFGCRTHSTLTQCYQDSGLRGNYVTYQPANRFWTFQWIESGIYLAFIVLALGATGWLVKRRLN